MILEESVSRALGEQAFANCKLQVLASQLQARLDELEAEIKALKAKVGE